MKLVYINTSFSQILKLIRKCSDIECRQPECKAHSLRGATDGMSYGAAG